MKISDLHTHPSLKPFQNRNEVNNSFQNIWNGVIGRNSYYRKLNKIIRDQIKETARDSQSQLNEFISGYMQTSVLVIHPIERGWFMRPRKKGRRFWKWLMRLLVNERKLPYLAASMTGIPLENAKNYIKEAKELNPVNYYDGETFPEYEYIASEEKKDATWNHKFELVSDFQGYQKAKNENKLPLFLSIEGGHALLDIPDGKMQRMEYHELTQSEIDHLRNSIVRNIERIKGNNDNKSFHKAHTPIYLTLTHMYQNFLTGHTRTYKTGGQFSPGFADLLDQKTALNQGLTELGKEAIDLLLSDQNGKRILIDIKHLSVKARKEYYEIAKNFNAPVIGSHIAMAGIDNFPENPKDTKKDNDGHYFSKWSINLSDEDARIIHMSDGIMGLVLHEGRMPGGIAMKKFKKIKKQIKNGNAVEELLRYEYMKLIMSNVFQIIIAIGEKEAWTRIMIGSDYDGIMNPFDIYPKSSYFNRFIYDLEKFLNKPTDLVTYRNSKESILSQSEVSDLMYGFSPKEIAEMIALKNFESFIKRHF
ncbi:MAG: membrane dipeptidase [Bacteroidota bacterium]